LGLFGEKTTKWSIKMNEKEYKLIRRCEGSNWEILIIGCFDTCKEHQEDDDAEYAECPNPDYKIIPISRLSRIRRRVNNHISVHHFLNCLKQSLYRRIH
jgi:hypothetical protein